MKTRCRFRGDCDRKYGTRWQEKANWSTQHAGETQHAKYWNPAINGATAQVFLPLSDPNLLLSVLCLPLLFCVCCSLRRLFFGFVIVPSAATFTVPFLCLNGRQYRIFRTAVYLPAWGEIGALFLMSHRVFLKYIVIT